MLRHCINSRRYQISARFFSNSNAWEEVRIPVPWGHVAGKWWGPKDKQPIFTSHGWLDNAGSFDTLLPLLPKSSSFLAIDFPGCGYSSKLPPGVLYHFIDSVILIRRIVKYFNWESVSLLGHSMGSLVNYVYTMLYPEEVNFLICLDALCPPSQDREIIKRMREGITAFIKYDHINSQNLEPPSYSYEELEQKINGNVLNSVDLDKSKYLLNRCIAPSTKDPNKYYFTMDPRVKIWDILRWSDDEMIDNANRLTCPILLIRASKSPFFKRKHYAVGVMDVLRRCNNNFQVVDVEGTHHVHLNHPERIENPLNEFLQKFNTESNIKKEGIIKSRL